MPVEQFEILRWDPVIAPQMSAIQPAMTFAPSASILRKYKDDSSRVPVKITDTRTQYDGVLTFASLVPSAVAGGFRPNYQESTGTWVLMTSLQWNGYPLSNGRVSILL